MGANVRYFVFDVESAADGKLISSLRYPEEALEPSKAVARWREELKADSGKDFIPYTFQFPITVALAKVSEHYELMDVISLSLPEFQPPEIVERFWRGWEKYARPILVTFNGRNFDIPLMELSAFRYGISVPGWFSPFAKSFDQPRNRFNQHAHLDLCDLFTNYGTTRFTGGLNLAANLIGKPGKMEIQGDMVQRMFEEQRFREIDEYCRCDVLDTYFVFLRSRVLMGFINLEEEQKLVEKTKKWIAARAETCEGYRLYMENWGKWENPWAADQTDKKS